MGVEGGPIIAVGIAVEDAEVRIGWESTHTGDEGGSEDMAGVFDVAETAETAEVAGETDGRMGWLQ